MRQNSKGSQIRPLLWLTDDDSIKCLSKWKGGKNLINGYIRITSSANLAAKLRSMIDALLSGSSSFFSGSSLANKLSKVVIACKAEK